MMFLLLLCTSWIHLHHLVVVNYSHFCPFSANCPLRSIRGRLFPPLSIWSIYDHWRLLELSPTSVSILLVIIIIFVYQCCRVGSPGCLLFVLVIASDYSDYSTANYNIDGEGDDDQQSAPVMIILEDGILILMVDPGPESGFLIIIFPLILFTILIILFVHLLKIIIGPLLSCRRCLSSLLITDYRNIANHLQQPTK